MRIRHVIIIVLFIGISTSLNAKTAAINKNYKKRPEWIEASKPGHLVACGIDLKREKAKNKAETALKMMVLNEAAILMITKNNYFKQIKLDTADARQLFMKSAFYSNFDNIKHNTFYSEKIKNPVSKAKEYHYYVQYIVNAEEINRVINKLAFDHEALTTFESVNAYLPGPRSVQVLADMRTKLMSLEPRFAGNDKRKTECNELLAKIDDVINAIQIAEMLNIQGKLIVCLTYNNKAILNAEKPVVNAKSVTINSIENTEEKWVIEYKSQNKNSSDSIRVEFNNAGIPIAKKFAIDPNAGSAEVKLTGAPIKIQNNRLITFSVASSCPEDIIVDRIVIHYNELNFTDDQLNQLLDGPAVYIINFLAPPDFYKIKVDDIVYGELHYRLKRTGKKAVFRFYNQRTQEI